jgi:hypothetical protein
MMDINERGNLRSSDLKIISVICIANQHEERDCREGGPFEIRVLQQPKFREFMKNILSGRAKSFNLRHGEEIWIQSRKSSLPFRAEIQMQRSRAIF